MRLLQRALWKRRLDPGERLLWSGAEARAFGRSDLPVWPFLTATVLLGRFVSRDFSYIEPWRIYAGIGAVIMGAWLFVELVFFTGISYYAITDKRIMERCLFRVTEIRLADIDYIGAGGIMRHMRALRTHMENARAAASEELADFHIPDLPEDLPEHFAVGAGDTEIRFAVKDPTEPARVIREILSGLEPKRSK